MPMKLLSTDAFRAAAKDGERPEGTVFRFAAAEPLQVGEDAARTQRFVFSDATIDHSGDSIDPKGWDLGVFNMNPVALFSHMSWDPPIGKAKNVGVVGDKLMGDIEFASADVYDFADTIYRLVKGGFLKAVSVGFIPKEWSFTKDKDRPYGIDFKQQRLLEISVCPVPCNPNALGEARSIGVDTRPLELWAERVLDSGDMAFMPRKDLEALRGQAGNMARKFYVSVARSLSATEVEQVRDSVKRWQADQTEVLVLPEGVEIKEVGEAKDGSDWKCGASTSLPIDEEGSWDGPAAEASIFAHAGGDDFDPAIAKTGFLAYDAAKPKLRGSYKLPFARVSGGKMEAAASGIRAAASRLPDTDIPDSVKTSARGVLDHYEAKMKKGAPIEVDLSQLLTQTEKAGRRISADTKAKLDDAMACHDAYHDAMTKCLKAVMEDSADPDLDDDGGTPAPDVDVAPDEPYEMTPEERRMKEAAAIKASLQFED